jgi:hypothetical protein
MDLSFTTLGDKIQMKYKKRLTSWNKGKPWSSGTREKMRLSKLKAPTRYWSGKHRSEDTKKKIYEKLIGRRFNRNFCKGEQHPCWKGGISTKNENYRKSIEFDIWRNSVYKRDGYRCRACGEKPRLLNAHHILSFSEYVDERFNIDNGITLCVPCHSRAHGKIRGGLNVKSNSIVDFISAGRGSVSSWRSRGNRELV